LGTIEVELAERMLLVPCLSIVRLKDACAVERLTSLIVTAYVTAALTTLGVPDTVPVDGSNDRPDGSAGDMLYVRAPVPLEPVIGMNGAP
jgi:hypothetical protein